MKKTKVDIKIKYSEKKKKDLLKKISKMCNGYEAVYEDGDFYVYLEKDEDWYVYIDSTIQMTDCHDRPFTDKLKDLIK